MISQLRKKIKPATLFLAKPFLWLKPDIINVLGLVFSLFFLFLLIQKQYPLALAAFILSGLCDVIDGAVARATKKVTAFGGLFDSSIDRLVDTFLITAFGFAHLVKWEIIVFLLSFSLIISYVRARAESAAKGEIILNVGLIERGERLITIFLALILYLLFPEWTIGSLNIIELIFLPLTFLSLATIFQRLMAASNQLRKLAR
jgi:archaetidylinositol phosphate synthase